MSGRSDYRYSVSEVLIGSRDDDMVVMSGRGDDVFSGGLGGDLYETRLIGNAGFRGKSLIADFGSSAKETETDTDTILIEGIRNFGDLSFERTSIAAEASRNTLEIDYKQYRDDDVWNTEDVGEGTDHCFAHGQIQIFNQFSISQRNDYSIEALQIGTEFENPLEAAVDTYYLGVASGKAEDSTEIISADNDQLSDADVAANNNWLMIGNSGTAEIFEIGTPNSTNTGDPNFLHSQKAIIYGFDLALDTIKINMNSTTAVHSGTLNIKRIETSDILQDEALSNMLGMDRVNIEIDTDGNLTTTDDITSVDLFFADLGNIDSSSLLEVIHFEN